MRIKKRMAGAVWAIGLWAAASAAPAEPPLRLAFNVPSQPVARALTDLGEQAGIQVLVRGEDIPTGKLSVPVQGELTVRDALDQALANSGLSYEFLDSHTVRIRAASAQTPSGPSQNTPSPAREGGKAPSPNGSQQVSPTTDRSLDEIVVTAQRRTQLLKDVPIAISVLSGSDLERSSVNSVSDALSTVPGVATTETQYGGGTQIAVRGVSASTDVYGGASPTAVYVDSVPFGFIRQSFTPSIDVYDLRQIEVLRGPQGTLYGANALNGVVRVLTNDANLSAFDFKARTSGSATNDGDESYRADLAVNVPLLPGKLAVRAVAGVENNGGWIDSPNRRDLNDVKSQNYRVKLNAQPSDTFAVGLSAWHSKSDFGSAPFADEDGRVTAVRPQPVNHDFDAYGLKLDKTFSTFTASSTTSYIDFHSFSVVDGTPISAPITLSSNFDSRVFSEELNFASTLKGPWRWSAGAFYRDDKDRNFQYITVFPGGILTPHLANFDDTSKSTAVYGEVGRHLTPTWELTLGARYFHDDEGTQAGEAYPGVPTTRLTSTSHAVTPRAVATWTPTADQTFYASYSEGFRSGLYQSHQVLTAAPNIPTLKPDKLHNYEIGAKGVALDNRITYDAAVFYIQWRDIQQLLGIPAGGGVFINAIVNGRSASGTGVEFAVIARPISGLRFGANLSWNNLEFDSDVLSGGAILFGKGDRPGFSPEYTAGVSAAYAFSLGASGYKAELSTLWNYTSPLNTTTVSVGSLESDSILLGRASFSIEAPQHWSATLFASNINNEHGAISPPIANIPEWAPRPRPRTIGVQLEYHF
jgi:iron complex outermembrane recepter protein